MVGISSHRMGLQLSGGEQEGNTSPRLGQTWVAADAQQLALVAVAADIKEQRQSTCIQSVFSE